MVGLEGAGKRALLQMLKLGPVTTTIPTIGFCVTSVEYTSRDCDVNFSVFDVGNNHLIENRRLAASYRMYYERSNSLIFVIDIANRVNIDQAVAEFHCLLSVDALKDVPLLVIGHNMKKHGNRATVSELDQLRDKLKQHRTVTDWTESGMCAFLMGTHPRAQGSAVLRLQGQTHLLELIWSFVKPLETVSCERVLQDRQWLLQSCHYPWDSDLYEGLDWLSKQLEV